MRRTFAHLLVAALVTASPLIAPALRAEGPASGDPPREESRQPDRRVEIVNDTGVPMTALYATNIGVDEWGPDHLGDKVLAPSERITINFDDGSGACWFDLKAVFDDGDVVVRRNFNVCKESGWRVFERKPGEDGQRV